MAEESKTIRVELLQPVDRGKDEIWEPGTVHTVKAEEAQSWLQLGVAKRPNADRSEVDPSTDVSTDNEGGLDVARAKAADIVADAEKKAAEIIAEADAAAEKTRAEAVADAEKTRQAGQQSLNAVPKKDGK